MWKLLQSRWSRTDTASRIYGVVVAQARDPALYTRLGLPDTPEGRYEAIVIHLVLAGARLAFVGPAGHELARTVNERFVTDMDDNLREMGVGDLTVPKKVKRAAAGLYERSGSYRAAMANGQAVALVAAFEEQMESEVVSQVRLPALADYVLLANRALVAQSDSEVLAGKLVFPPVAATP